MYLNYHPTEEFPINLENVYKLLGFANKEKQGKIDVLTKKTNKFVEGQSIYIIHSCMNLV